MLFWSWQEINKASCDAIGSQLGGGGGGGAAPQAESRRRQAALGRHLQKTKCPLFLLEDVYCCSRIL